MTRKFAFWLYYVKSLAESGERGSFITLCIIFDLINESVY